MYPLVYRSAKYLNERTPILTIIRNINFDLNIVDNDYDIKVKENLFSVL